MGWSEIQEIHQQIELFHDAGGRSAALLERADNETYYLASGTRRIYVTPSAALDLIGLRAEGFFLKNLLDHLGIEPQLYSLGDYKSAAEMFTREKMSSPSRANTDSILDDLQQQLIDRVARSRSVSELQVQQWIDRGPFTARQARDQGLIDGIAYEDEVQELFRLQRPALSELPLSKLKSREGFLKRLLTFYRPQIAYLVVDGVLSSGESRRGTSRRPVVGAETPIRLLRETRRRKRVKAIVLRVNSPGGSAPASDLVWRQIHLTNKEKPVIISFGDVAASGGYYLATAGRAILGMPGTLTGSIGVVQGKFNLGKLFSKLGVTVDGLDKGKRAGYLSLARAFSKDEAGIIQDQLREFYEELFLKKVCESRKKLLEEVRKLAEGRLWTGRLASENALLDRLGGLIDALKLAQSEAGLPEEKGAGSALLATTVTKGSVSVPGVRGLREQPHSGLMVGRL